MDVCPQIRKALPVAYHCCVVSTKVVPTAMTFFALLKVSRLENDPNYQL